MKVASFKNFVESGILFLPDIIKVDPLHRDNRLVLHEKHIAIPILMKQSPKTLIGDLFLGLVVVENLALLHYLGGLNLVVVYHCSVGMNFWSSHLQCLILIWSGRSGMMRRRVLRSGVLTKTAWPWPLCKLLRVIGGSPT
jgi:hypothetical protein